MELGFAIITEKTLHFSPQHYFKIHLEKNGITLEETKGEDRFDYDGMLMPGAPVVATGRSVVHSFEPDLQAYAGTPAGCITLPDDDDIPFAGMKLFMETNSVLDQGELQTYFSLQATINGRRHLVPLLTRRVFWESRGKFCIDIGKLQ